MRILVLCAGNIGRSPLAEAMLKHSLATALGVGEGELADTGVTVSSAGTAAPEGHAASGRGIAFAAECGLDLGGHKATQMTPEAVAAADLIFCMDRQQLAAVAALDPPPSGEARLLAGEGIEIPDPHHHDDKFFRDVAARIERAVAEWVPELVDRTRAPHTGTIRRPNESGTL